MESPARKVSRLLGALETLSDQEFSLLNAGEHTEARALQDRRQPIVDEIVRIMAQPGVAQSLDSSVLLQAEELISKHAEQIARMDVEKAALRAGLNSISGALTRTHQFRSAYHSKGSSSESQGYTGTA